jgi:O-antigen ligase
MATGQFLYIAKIKPHNFSSTLFGILIGLLFLSGNFSLNTYGGNIEIRYLLGASALMLTMAAIAIRDNLSFPRLGLFMSMPWVTLMFLTLSSLWSSNIEQASLELVDLLVLWFISILALLVFYNFPKAIGVALLVVLVFSLVYSLLAIATSIQSGGRGTIMIGGPNVATRVMFFGVVSILLLNLYFRSTLLIFAVPIIISGIIAIGSRGGIVGASVVLVLIAVIKLFRSQQFRSNISYGKLITVTSATLIFYFFLFPLVYRAFESRVVNLLINRVYLAGRDSMYEKAWDLVQLKPIFGYGLGGYYGQGLSFYPHNLVLQLWLDGGFILIMCFFVMLWSSLKGMFSKDSAISYASMGALYMLIVQQFSGGYMDFRYYYFFVAILTVLSLRKYDVRTQ